MCSWGMRIGTEFWLAGLHLLNVNKNKEPMYNILSCLEKAETWYTHLNSLKKGFLQRCRRYISAVWTEFHDIYSSQCTFNFLKSSSKLCFVSNIRSKTLSLNLVNSSVYWSSFSYVLEIIAIRNPCLPNVLASEKSNPGSAPMLSMQIHFFSF